MRCSDACASARPSIEGLGIVAARPCYRPCGGANKLGRELQLGFSVLLLIPSAVTIHGTGAMACGTNMHTWKWNAGGESSGHGQVRCRVASAAQSAAVRVLLSAYITAALLHGLTGLCSRTARTCVRRGSRHAGVDRRARRPVATFALVLPLLLLDVCSWSAM